MISNIYFWLTGGYFALADSITPMLHTWSLGVEEQFYIFFPIVLIIAERLRLTRAAILLIGIASFALCLIGTAVSPTATFYLLPTRAWELMIGAALAVFPIRLPKWGGLAGLAALVAAAVAISGDDPFPGWRALVPALGAALIIGSGRESPSGRLLAVPPLVAIGKISYSLYLWHWPVFVFLRHYSAAPVLPAYASAAGILVSFLCAAASYRWVEQPARRRGTKFRAVAIASTAAAALVLGGGFVAIASDGLPSRFNPRVLALARGHQDFAPFSQACTGIGFDAALRNCRWGGQAPPAVVLWGDSHAGAASEGVMLGLDKPGVVFAMGVCAPTESWLSPELRGREPAACRKLNGEVLQFVKQTPSVKTVLLSSYWAWHERTGGADFWRSVQKLADQLRSEGREVAVLTGVPEPGVDVPWASAIRARFGRVPLQLDCHSTRPPLRGVRIIDISGGFCQGDPRRLFADATHISRFAGQQIVAPAVRRQLGSDQTR